MHGDEVEVRQAVEVELGDVGRQESRVAEVGRPGLGPGPLDMGRVEFDTEELGVLISVGQHVDRLAGTAAELAVAEAAVQTRSNGTVERSI